MEEETTLSVEETTEEVNLFGDDDLFSDDELTGEPEEKDEQERAEEGKNEGQEEPEKPAEAPKETKDFRPIKGTYNGKPFEVADENEAVTLVQKGMNYDHVHQELEQLRNSP